MKNIEAVKIVIGNMERHGGTLGDRGSLRVFSSKNLDLTGEDRSLILKFCGMCREIMNLEGDYSCYLVDDRKGTGIVTTAICEIGNGRVKIYCKGRAISDILRSIAHELFHLKQYEMGLINKKLRKHHLEPIEWHANAISGSLLSYFASLVGRDKVYR